MYGFVQFLIRIQVSCIDTVITDHLKVFFRDMSDQTADKVHDGDCLLNVFFVLMPVVIKGDILSVIVQDALCRDHRTAKISADILKDFGRFTFFGFCIYVESVLMIPINSSFCLFKRVAKSFVQQAEDFKRILKEEKESFEQVNQDLQTLFSNQLKEIPMLEQKLADVAEIPQKIDDMITRLEQSNSQLYSNFVFSSRETLIQFAKANKENGKATSAGQEIKPYRTSWIVIVCAVLIAIACISNTIHNIWFASEKPPIEAPIKNVTDDIESTLVTPQEKDSVQLQHAQQPVQTSPDSIKVQSN